ncbi:MAG: sulfatase-like hydrolase/transferase [Woeseiaceae bacterium]|nr:sulfatase-like hydrolase/transferase [Woeseiaceae bacterium]
MRLSNVGITAALAAILLLTVAVFVSLTIYSGNVSEFSIAWPWLLVTYLPYVTIAVLALALPGAFLGKDALSRYWAVLAALGCLAWLQGNILVWNYGALDGRSIAWTAGAWRGVLDAAIWIGVLTVAVRFYTRFGRTLVMCAIAVFAMQTVGAALTLVSGNGELLVREDVFAEPENTASIFELSDKANVVHIVMDGFQTDIFRNILDGEHGDSIIDELRGFTLFEQNLGAYPYTQLTIPALLTGKLYRNEVPMDDFVEAALRGDTILGAALDAGYEVDIAAPIGIGNVYSAARHTNLYGITPGFSFNRDDIVALESAKLADLALFRVVPHFVKALVHRDELWIFQARARSEEYLHIQYFSDVAFLNQMAENLSVGRSSPVYKLIHVMLAHKPTVGTASCKYAGRQPTTRETVVEHATCGLLRVAAILRKMKELGAYDNSLIVLMADHGAWVPIDGFQGHETSAAEITAMTVAMASPMLAAKPPAATGALQVSGKPTSIIDVPATIANILGVDSSFPGNPAFGALAGEERDRFHALYGFGNNPDAPGYLFPMQEFRVSGDSHDASNWHIGSLHLPGSRGSSSQSANR